MSYKEGFPICFKMCENLWTISLSPQKDNGAHSGRRFSFFTRRDAIHPGRACKPDGTRSASAW